MLSSEAAVDTKSEQTTSSTQWGWIAFAILAAAVLGGGIVWWWRSRAATVLKKADDPRRYGQVFEYDRPVT